MTHRLLIARLTASFPCSNKITQPQLGSALPHSALLFFNAFTSESESQTNHPNGDTFTVSYLIDSCGLSPESAKKLTEKVNLKNPDGPNAVLELLKSYGFSKTQVAKLVERRPWVLVSNAETTLLPKLKFFHSIGVSNTDTPKILIQNGALLGRSLEGCLVPRYKVLKSVLCDDDKRVVTALKSGPWCFTYCDLPNDLVANTNVLREFGVPQDCISLLVCYFPNAACTRHSRFVEAVKKAKEMGFDPSKSLFVVAVQVFVKMTEELWESRLEIFEKCGWSKDITLLAFKRYPLCMLMSENKVMRTMRFLVKDMGWPSEDIARTPGVLSPNLENTIMPRCNVVKVLKSKGLIKNDLSIGTFIMISEKNFLKRYVTQFQENVPLLMQIYKGQTEYLDIL